PDPQVCAMHEATTAERHNRPLVNPPSACCIVNGGVCKIKTTLLLRAYPTRRHTMRSGANCTRTRELCGFFSRRMSSLRKRSRPPPSRADTAPLGDPAMSNRGPLGGGGGRGGRSADDSRHASRAAPLPARVTFLRAAEAPGPRRAPDGAGRLLCRRG